VASISGLIIKDVKVGTGATAKAGDVVSVHYTGKFADGKVFDSSISRGQPIEFVLGIGQVIKGWDEGLKGMKVGGKRTFEISPNLAYGASGVPGAIPVNATLFFEVELVGVRAQ
jgi:peptidylprolyl isomerase